MIKKILSIALLLLVLAGVFLLFSRTKAGSDATDFQAELIDGTAFQLSDLRGSYVLLDFWGSWCPPCRKDNPKLVAFHQEYHGKSYKDAADFEVVSIALEKNNRRYKQVASKDGITWKHQIVRIAKLVLSDPLALKYGVKEVPTKILIGPNGKVIGVNMKWAEMQSLLDGKVG